MGLLINDLGDKDKINVEEFMPTGEYELINYLRDERQYYWSVQEYYLNDFILLSKPVTPDPPVKAKSSMMS